jgi:hypothetical protein
MRAFLSETDTLVAIQKCCRRAKKMKAALALITRSGLQLIDRELDQLLARGGEFQVLLGTDMATEPEAIDALLRLQKEYSDQMTIRRFAVIDHLKT